MMRYESDMYDRYMAYLEHCDELEELYSEDELMHYGVPGMKWGVRKALEYVRQFAGRARKATSRGLGRARATGTIAALRAKKAMRNSAGLTRLRKRAFNASLYPRYAGIVGKSAAKRGIAGARGLAGKASRSTAATAVGVAGLNARSAAKRGILGAKGLARRASRSTAATAAGVAGLNAKSYAKRGASIISQHGKTTLSSIGSKAKKGGYITKEMGKYVGRYGKRQVRRAGRKAAFRARYGAYKAGSALIKRSHLG